MMNRTRKKFIIGKKRKKVGLLLLKTHKRSIPRPSAYSPRGTMFKCAWRFTLGDPDDNPSVPHAHAVDKGYRLNAWTGDVYPAGNERKKTIGKLSKSELASLHSDQGFIKFAKKQIEWYRKEYPDIVFFVPDWFKCKYLMSRQLASFHNEDEEESFIFVGNVTIY